MPLLAKNSLVAGYWDSLTIEGTHIAFIGFMRSYVQLKDVRFRQDFRNPFPFLLSRRPPSLPISCRRTAPSRLWVGSPPYSLPAHAAMRGLELGRRFRAEVYSGLKMSMSLLWTHDSTIKFFALSEDAA